MIRAAGILFLAPGQQGLFLKRGNGGDHPGEWCFPGGHAEGDETAEACAIRETEEEAGRKVRPTELKAHTRSIAIAQAGPTLPAEAVPATDVAVTLPAEPSVAPAPSPEVDFTTFVVRVDEQFTPELNDEHTGWAWASVDDPPEPLHPGCRVALSRLTMDELGVARAMAAGSLTSPQRYENVTLWAMRITGTGMAYRAQLKEYVWRDPSVYMNEEFIARCNGLTVIMLHPKKGATLTSDEFADRAVGSILLPYLRPEANEVWGIAKVYDDEANAAIPKYNLSTSPAVVFRDPSVNTKMKLSDGSPLLIEGKPSLLDHLAICEQGVWDKGGEPSGITINDSTGGSTVADENEDKKEEKADAGRADADGGTTLDKVLSKLDAMSSRMDSMEEERKADSARRDSAMKDADKDEDDKSKSDADEGGKAEDEPKEVVADKRKDAAEDVKEAKSAEDSAKKDSEDDKSKDEKADSTVKADPEVQRRLRDLERAMPKQMSDADFASMSDAQARADQVFQAFGDAAPRPLQGEDLGLYRRRLAHNLKGRSGRYKDVNVHSLSDSAAFDIIEAGIYADAMEAAMSPEDLGAGELRALKARDVTGREITTFAGRPSAWMSGFTGHRRRLVGIRQ